MATLILFIFVVGSEVPKKAVEQWKWIEETLASSKADYLLVGGHFPVWSIAEHGPTEILVHSLKPLLEKYKVTSYISGHDHNLQVILLSFFFCPQKCDFVFFLSDTDLFYLKCNVNRKLILFCYN